MVKPKIAIVKGNVSNLWLVQSVGDCSGLELGRGKIYPSILHTHTHSTQSFHCNFLTNYLIDLSLMIFHTTYILCECYHRFASPKSQLIKVIKPLYTQ